MVTPQLQSQPTSDSSDNIEATERDNEDRSESSETAPKLPEPPFSIFTNLEKKLIVMTISFVSVLSPMSASIYLPALGTLSKDLNVTTSMINLTITTYMIFQGLAPTLFGSFSDTTGRRPAYAICLTIYLSANIGLALQNDYAALLVLRCLQSSGSSATIALGNAVVADVSTRAERGKWIAYANMGSFLGPSLGPVIGGLLNTYLGWRAIFWFLCIFGGVMGVITLCFVPETCRAVVGNGSVAPQRWNRTLPAYLKRKRSQSRLAEPDLRTISRPSRRPNLLTSLSIVFEKEAGLVLLFGAVLYAGFYTVMATLTTQLQEKYGFGTLIIGLCYLPLGVGALLSRFSVGILSDWNYKRHMQPSGTLEEQQRADPDDIPIEKIRLQIGIPATYAAAAVIVVYGWVMQYNTPVAAPLVLLFFIGNFATGAFNIFSTLIVDINQDRPATAVAANNLARCLLGAAFVSFADPLIDDIGIGWTSTFIVALWMAFSPCLWAVQAWGQRWRREEKARLKKLEERDRVSEV